MVIMQNILNIDYAVKRKNIWLGWYMVQAASHPAVKKVLIESPVLHSAMQFSSYIHYSSDADCVPSDRHKYQLIVVDEPQPMLLEVSAQCHELTFIEMQSWGVMAKFITETLFIQLACKIVKQSV